VTLGWFFLWRYEPHAREHIPDRTNVAVRVEAADFILFGPVRRHLWPLLEEARAEPKAGAPKRGKSRLERIKDATGVDFSTDARELLVASVDAQSWLVIVGGRLRRGRFVKGLLAVLQEDGSPGWSASGELLVGPGGLAVGQADDGTLLFGTDAAIVTAALPATDEWKRLELPERGAVTMFVAQEAWKGVSSKLAAAPGTEALAKVQHATGKMILGDAPSLDLVLKAEAGETGAVARGLESALAAARLTTLLAPDHYGEKAALNGAKVSVEKDAVRLVAPWPIDGLDRACTDLALALRAGRAVTAP